MLAAPLAVLLKLEGCRSCDAGGGDKRPDSVWAKMLPGSDEWLSAADGGRNRVPVGIGILDTEWTGSFRPFV